MKIAIDGPAGAGKSTVAKMVAVKLGYLYIDTGAMYRAIAWLARARNVSPQNGPALAELAKSCNLTLKPGVTTGVFVDDQDISSAIRLPEISELVGPVSAQKELREELVKQQQAMAHAVDAVLDGRDIGTVVLPDAEVKVFLTASPEVRAHRRLKDIQKMGLPDTFDQILKAIVERDHKDSTRAESPLRQAEDALKVDTDAMSIDQVVETILLLCAKCEKTIRI
jgi:cytidylate kinase